MATRKSTTRHLRTGPEASPKTVPGSSLLSLDEMEEMDLARMKRILGEEAPADPKPKQVQNRDKA